MTASARARRVEDRLHSRLMAVLNRQADMLTPEEHALLVDLLEDAVRRADPSYRSPTPEELQAMPEPRLTLAQIRFLLIVIQKIMSLRPPAGKVNEEAILAAADAILARRKARGE